MAGFAKVPQVSWEKGSEKSISSLKSWIKNQYLRAVSPGGLPGAGSFTDILSTLFAYFMDFEMISVF